ncbi:AraC family transcriptional regulator [Halioxenophilus aromaticivorans]
MEQITGEQKIEAESQVGLGQVRVVSKFWDKPVDILGHPKNYHLEMSLLPRPEMAQACFVDHWSPKRFEPFGDLFLLPAEHRIRAQSNCRHQNSIVFTFSQEAVAPWFDHNLRWTDSRLQGALDIASGKIRSLLFQIGEELRSPRFASGNMVELLSSQVIIELSRYLHSVDEEKSRGGLSELRLRRIDERLSERDIPPSLAELADLCNLSVRQLTRAFRVSRGRSIGKYIAEYRLDRAKRLLASGMSVKCVAYTVGFSAPSNFTAAFLRETGETPRDYRLRLKGSQPVKSGLH